MKNKFKKSKIIVPALALITATTVASVTGTVAWFTASRAVTISASQFHTTTLDSNLKVKVEAYHEAGTTGTNSTTPSDSGTVTVDGLMTHGSYAASNLQTSGNNSGETATTANLYTPKMDSDSVTGYESKGRAETNGVAPSTGTTEKVYPWKAGSKTVNSTSTNIWYGVAWKMTFSIDSEVTGVTNTLHFDPASSTFTDSSTGTGTKTAQGLRIAFMTTSNYLVAAGDNVATHVNAAAARYEYTKKTDLSSETYAADTWFATNTTAKALNEDEFNSYKNIDGANYGNSLYKGTKKDGTETSYDSSKIVNVNSISTMTYPSDGATNLKTNASYYYLGDITATTSLEVIAVAWFEGTDPAVVSTSTMSNVAASLKFFSRQA